MSNGLYSTLLTTFFGTFIALTQGCSSQISAPTKTNLNQAALDEAEIARQDSALGLKQNPNRQRVKAAPSLRAQRMEALDFSPDGFPRIKRHYTTGTTGIERVERIETDFNGDGRIDFVQWLDASSTWVERDASDLNGDGLLDIVNHYKKNVNDDTPELVLQTLSTPRSRSANIWKHYRNGELRMRAIDRKLNGKADYWEYYENGKLVRKDFDNTGDGKPDGHKTLPKVVTPKGNTPLAR
jgi:hypothetical protein